MSNSFTVSLNFGKISLVGTSGPTSDGTIYAPAIFTNSGPASPLVIKYALTVGKFGSEGKSAISTFSNEIP